MECGRGCFKHVRPTATVGTFCDSVKAGDQESDQGGSTAHGVSCWPET